MSIEKPGGKDADELLAFCDAAADMWEGEFDAAQEIRQMERQGDGSLVFPRRKIMKKDKRTVPLSFLTAAKRYLCKLQQRASRNAWDFCEDIRKEINGKKVIL